MEHARADNAKLSGPQDVQTQVFANAAKFEARRPFAPLATPCAFFSQREEFMQKQPSQIFFTRPVQDVVYANTILENGLWQKQNRNR